jgi:hypothetical protein
MTCQACGERLRPGEAVVVIATHDPFMPGYLRDRAGFHAECAAVQTRLQRKEKPMMSTTHSVQPGAPREDVP